MGLRICLTARKLFTLAACCVTSFHFSVAQAENPKSDSRVPTQEELRLLPPYCPNTQIISRIYGRQQAPSNYDAKTKPYVDLYGADFWHLHHYCFGLVNVIRSHREFDRRKRDRLLRESVGEINYVLKGISPDSILRPELHVKKAQSLILMGRGAEAVGDLKRAIALNPAYSVAYASLSDYYKEAGKKELALTTLEEGLSQSPTERSLLRRYERLGGKKTFAPPPAAELAVEPVPTQEHPVKQADTAVEPEQAPSVPPIGNDTNPYCRFCP